MDATYDLFLSYRWADNSAVEPLLTALQVQGNESRACRWELSSAYSAAQVEADPRRRILVVNPEKGNAHVHLPELFDQLHLSGAEVPGDAAAVQSLAARIQAALERVPTTELGALRSLAPPLWLPAMGTGSNSLVGRLREMWNLHGALQAGQAGTLTGTGGRAGLALVRGAGGIGKSLMTERDTQELDIALRLGTDRANLNPAQVRGALARHLAQQAQPYLWVVDDPPPDPGPEGLGGWQAPHPLGCTLFTTRTRRFNGVTTRTLTSRWPRQNRSRYVSVCGARKGEP